jgi:cellulase
MQQFYASCYQVTVSGGGSASPATVKFPGAYSATDPGILVNIHQNLQSYIIPGPAVYGGGGGGSTTTIITTQTTHTPMTTTTQHPTTVTSSTPTTTGATAALYAQCGGKGWTGATVCAQGTCKASGDYYSQCLP